MKSPKHLLAIALGMSCFCIPTGSTRGEMTTLQATRQNNEATLANDIDTLKVDAAKRSITLTDASSGVALIDSAWVAADGWGGDLNNGSKPEDLKDCSTVPPVEPVVDSFGKGQRVVLEITQPHRASLPAYLFSHSLRENTGVIHIGFRLA